MDLISRQAVLDKAYELDLFDTGNDIQIWVVDVDDVKKLPTADLSKYCDKLWKTAYERGKAEAHPKKGKWMEKWGDTVCPFCGFSCDDIYYLHEGNYCPDCGAKLEWEE